MLASSSMEETDLPSLGSQCFHQKRAGEQSGYTAKVSEDPERLENADLDFQKKELN